MGEGSQEGEGHFPTFPGIFGAIMLKKIPTNISPALMHTLMSMGHGDEIVIADGPLFAHLELICR